MVDATGRVIALSPGTALITATSEGRSGTDTLTAMPVAPTATAAFTLVGAGVIARGDSLGDVVTAAALDTVPGTVVTLGNCIIRNAAACQFTKSLDPSWGPRAAGTRPAVGA